MTAPISFGLGMLSGQRPGSESRSFTELYRELIELCEYAEELGFDSAWLSEHHFVDDGYLPSLLPMAAAVAARTTRLQIGTGVLLAPLHDPVCLAEDAAVVDLISAGRLILGLGAGYREEEFAGFGRAATGLGLVLDRRIQLLRDAWAGAAVQGEGADPTPVVVTPRPDRPGGPPIWLGARSRAALHRVARAADGLLAARVSPTQFGEQVAVIDDELDRLGRPHEAVAVGVHCPVFAWPDGSGRDLVEPALHYVEWKYADMVQSPYAQRSTPTQPPALGDADRDVLFRGALVGDPQQVAEAIGAYAEQAGRHPFHFVARLYWPGLAAGQQRAALQVFAEEVMPSLAVVPFGSAQPAPS